MILLSSTGHRLKNLPTPDCHEWWGTYRCRPYTLMTPTLLPQHDLTFSDSRKSWLWAGITFGEKKRQKQVRHGDTMNANDLIPIIVSRMIRSASDEAKDGIYSRLLPGRSPLLRQADRHKKRLRPSKHLLTTKALTSALQGNGLPTQLVFQLLPLVWDQGRQ